MDSAIGSMVDDLDVLLDDEEGAAHAEVTTCLLDEVSASWSCKRLWL